MAVFLLAAFLVRIVQIFTVIDSKTGFYNRGSATLGMILTVSVFALCFVGSIFARKGFIIKKRDVTPLMIVPSCFLGISLLYEVFAESFVNQGNGWQVILMKALGILAAVYFVSFNFLKIPDLCHIIPALYMIIRIICSFINIASLSLIAENVLYTAGLCCALLFFVSYAGHYCLDDINAKSLNFRAVLAGSLCFVTAASNIIAEIFSKGGYDHIPFYSKLVMLAVSLFIGGFVASRVKSNME